MEQIIGESFPQNFSFQKSLHLSWRCVACGSVDRFEFTLPGFDGSHITFMNPLSTKYYPAAELHRMVRWFPGLSIVEKESRSIVTGNTADVPDAEKLPVNVFQRTCAHCGSVTLFQYDIGYGEQERGLNETNRLVIHAIAGRTE